MSSSANKLTIHTDKGEHKISRHIYGHFAEHLGRGIYEGIWVGEDSEIPNTRGIRNDVVNALRDIRIPNLRWPGGCFADDYHWQDGIGPRRDRPETTNVYWGQVTENNHFGTHEFLDLCDQLGCEPYICGNVGSGTPQEMRDWVEYLTFEGRSRLTEQRRKNGREEPWNVTFWGVGNENWGCGGTMRPEYYADLYKRFQSYLYKFGGNNLYRIACGAMDDNYQWTEVLMREAAACMDGLSLHYYTLPGDWKDKGSALDFDEGDWFNTLKKAGFMAELLEKHGAIMDKYDPEKRVGLVVDEWGTWYNVEPGTHKSFLNQQNTIRDALTAASTLNIFNQSCRRVKMANLAQTVNVLQSVIHTQNELLMLTPTYHVFKMFAVHQDATLLPVDINCATYTCGDEGMRALNASATLDDAGVIHISLCNVDPGSALQITCALGTSNPVAVSGKILTSTQMNACNTFEDPDKIQPEAFEDIQLNRAELKFEQPPKSVLMLEVVV